MAGYTATFATTQSGATTTYARSFAIRAGSYAIKISKIDLMGFSYQVSSSAAGAKSLGYANLNHYIGSTISGGSLLTPQPLREGADPASATVRYSTATVDVTTFAYSSGSLVGVTGTALQAGYEVLDVAATTPTTFQPTFDQLIAPGSVLYIQPKDYTFTSGPNTFTYNAQYSLIIVWFEEYHLARSV